MKKLISSLLVAGMMFAMVGCGNNAAPHTQTPQATAPVQTETAQPSNDTHRIYIIH